MEETIPSPNDLEQCFNELKNLALVYRLGPTPSTSGDNMQNPLHKQFELILSKIEAVLKRQIKNSEEYLRAICMKSSIIYEKAKILLSENLLSEGNDMLEDSLNVISDYSDHQQVHFLYLRVMNHWTYVLSRIGHLEKAKDALTKIIEDEHKCKPEVFSTDDLFLNTKKDEQTSMVKLNRLTINNMQLLAWIYGKLGDVDAHLKTQHDILQKQLDFNEDVLKWAESCYKLAGMFIGNGDWENARYHLSAAESVLKPLEISFDPIHELHAVQADIARTWVCYGLQLFQASKEIDWDLKSELDPDGTLQDADNENEIATTPKQATVHFFNGLFVEIPESVPTVTIRTLSQAKALFGTTYKWIKRSRLYYSLRDYPLQFVNLGLDLSELYRFWSSYEADVESQYMVQKKRYDALETLTAILKDVRPNCYTALLIELTKEIIEVQMEMMGLNLKKMFTPADDVSSKNANEELTKRQMSAFASAQSKLEQASSYFETNSRPVETTSLKKETRLIESESCQMNEKCIEET